MMNDQNTSPASDTPWTAEVGGDGFYRVVNAKAVVLAQKCVAEEAVLFAAAPRLVAALERLLDVFLDGRMEELMDREQEVYAEASAALAAAAGHDVEAAAIPGHGPSSLQMAVVTEAEHGPAVIPSPPEVPQHDHEDA